MANDHNLMLSAQSSSQCSVTWTIMAISFWYLVPTSENVGFCSFSMQSSLNSCDALMSLSPCYYHAQITDKSQIHSSNIFFAIIDSFAPNLTWHSIWTKQYSASQNEVSPLKALSLPTPPYLDKSLPSKEVKSVGSHLSCDKTHSCFAIACFYM